MLHSICGNSSLLWDFNLTWNTTTPDFTNCFQTTLLIWIPTGIFWLLASFEFYKAFCSTKRKNLLTPIHMSKQIVNGLILIATIMKLVCNTWLYSDGLVNYEISNILSNAIEIATMVIAIFLTAYSRHKGILISNALPIFWLLQFLAFVAILYSAAMKSIWLGDTVQLILSFAIMFSTPLALLQLILTSFCETASSFERLENDDRNTEKNCPAESNSFFPFIMYSWVTKLLLQGYRGDFKPETMDPLCRDMQSETTSRDFDIVFLPKPERRGSINNTPNSEVAFQTAEFGLKKKSLLISLWRMAWRPFFLGGIYELISIFTSFIPAYTMHLILGFVQSDEVQWHGFVYAFSFWLSTVLYSTLDSLSQYFSMVASIQIKSALTSAVYRKVLLLSNPAKRKYTCGEIVNLMSIDTEEIFNFTSYVYQFLGVPIRICLTMYFLWGYIGPSSLASLGVFVILSPLSYVIGLKIDKLQEKVMLKKDKRIKQMAEILNGIKILKLYAWERPFMKQVLKTRDEELGFLRTSCYIDSFFVFLWVVAPFLVCAVCFGTYLLSSTEHLLDPQTAFVSLTLFNLLRYPLGILPDLLTRMVKSLVSLKRLNTFLYGDEIDLFNVTNETDPGDAVTFRNATMSWDSELEPALKNITLKIPKGSLVAIVGPVGCGKSSILSAILGEMEKLSGDVSKKGKIAFVPQLAWIQNATLQKNITFKKPLIQNIYAKVVKSCALEPDLELLSGGDKTEIGEKGINLSGGQKQRISLARAVYQDEDIYLLDDPLSAVDANVAAQLFNEVIGPTGMLKKKTRILATHNISYLSEMDRIIVISEGEIAEQGTYTELMNNKGKFSEFLNQHTNQEKKGDDEEEKKKPMINRQISAISNTSQASSPEEEFGNGQLTEEETMALGQVKWQVYKSYIQCIGVGFFVIICLFNACSGGFETGSGLWLSHWSTEVGDRQSQLTALWVYFGFIGCLATVICLCYVVLFWGTVRAAKKIHETLLDSVMKSPLSFFDTTPTGRILNRFSKDVESIDAEIPFALGNTLNNLFWLPIIVIIISISSVYLLPFLAIALFFYFFVLKGYILTSNQLRRLDSVSRSPVYSNFTETIQGVSSIRAYKAQSIFITRSYERVDNNLKYYYYRQLTSRWLDMALAIVASIIILSTALICVFERYNIGAGVLGLALTYCAELTGGLGWLVKIGAMLESQIVSLERILEYSALTPEGEWEVSGNSKPVSAWPQKGEIEVSDYSTAYREGLDPVLKNVNLSIEPGMKVGVVGRTGAGKSSFILSLFRILEPTQGTIIIDGVDITKIGTHDLRAKLTVIPQDPVLFAGSFRMNLDPWNEHTDDEIWLSLERSHLKVFVTSLPEGLEHEITEGGDNLSAGQRQLVCLARALLRRTKILVLDEATASVDLDTDHLIQETVREAFKECTVITIAHRLHTILKCDKIICFSQGKLVEEGSPESLLADSASHFYSMAKDAGIV